MTYYNDPIADLINRIRNAYMAKHNTVRVSASKLKVAILDLLIQQGYILGYEIIEERPTISTLVIELKYYEGTPAIKKIKRYSKLGQRKYANVKKIPVFYNGLGVSILSTSKGVMTDIDARKLGVGGEVLLQVF